MLWAPLSCTSKDIRIFEEQDFILELFLKNSIKIELFIYVKEESKKKRIFGILSSISKVQRYSSFLMSMN